jgi:hypothetical protein
MFFIVQGDQNILFISTGSLQLYFNTFDEYSKWEKLVTIVAHIFVAN